MSLATPPASDEVTGPVDLSRPHPDPSRRQRHRFVRWCGYAGATVIVLGAAGIARLSLVGIGGLIVVIGLLAYLIDLEPEHDHETPEPSLHPPHPDDRRDRSEGSEPTSAPMAAQATDPVTDPEPVELPPTVTPPVPAREPSPMADAVPDESATAAVAGDPPDQAAPATVAGDPPDGADASDAADTAGSRLVRFRLPATVEATTVHLVGEFNGWSRTATPLERREDWFETELLLATGRTYRYRYLLDGTRWENAWDADTYAPNAHGTEDSVIDLTRPSSGPTS